MSILKITAKTKHNNTNLLILNLITKVLLNHNRKKLMKIVLKSSFTKVIKKICRIISMWWVLNKIRSKLKAMNVRCVLKIKITQIFLEIKLKFNNNKRMSFINNNIRMRRRRIRSSKCKMMRIIKDLRKKSSTKLLL